MGDKAIERDIFGLSDSESLIGGLVLYGWVESYTRGFEGEDEDFVFWVIWKILRVKRDRLLKVKRDSKKGQATLKYEIAIIK